MWRRQQGVAWQQCSLSGLSLPRPAPHAQCGRLPAHPGTQAPLAGCLARTTTAGSPAGGGGCLAAAGDDGTAHCCEEAGWRHEGGGRPPLVPLPLHARGGTHLASVGRGPAGAAELIGAAHARATHEQRSREASQARPRQVAVSAELWADLHGIEFRFSRALISGAARPGSREALKAHALVGARPATAAKAAGRQQACRPPGVPHRILRGWFRGHRTCRGRRSVEKSAGREEGAGAPGVVEVCGAAIAPADALSRPPAASKTRTSARACILERSAKGRAGEHSPPPPPGNRAQWRERGDQLGDCGSARAHAGHAWRPAARLAAPVRRR